MAICPVWCQILALQTKIKSTSKRSSPWSTAPWEQSEGSSPRTRALHLWARALFRSISVRLHLHLNGTSTWRWNFYALLLRVSCYFLLFLQNHLKDILTSVVSRRKAYRVRDGHFKYAFGSNVTPQPYLKNSVVAYNNLVEGWVSGFHSLLLGYRPYLTGHCLKTTQLFIYLFIYLFIHSFTYWLYISTP